MKKIITIFTLLFILTIFSACSNNENLSGLYQYKNGDNTYYINLNPYHEPGLKWINENLPKDAIITSWFDYGHSIQAIGKRKVIAFSPSNEILEKNFVGEWDIKKLGELSEDSIIQDIALILTTTDSNKAESLMKKYNSEYIFISKGDSQKSYAFYNLSGIEHETYWNGNNVNLNSIFIKMIQNEEIDKFSEIYSDSNIVIYQLNS